jgi:protease-4
MRPRRWLCAALLVAACSSGRSPLDPTVASGGAAGDPWAGGGERGPRDAPDRKGGDDLGDLQQMLSRVAESIQRPGPYEAPERSKDGSDDAPRWGVLELGGDVVERRAYGLRGGGGLELGQLIERLRAFARQDELAGLLLRVEEIAISIPDAVELRSAMHELRRAGKPIACHAEDASNATYLVLAACERIAIAPLGQLTVSGPAAMPIHVRSLLDKLGVYADFLHIGAYKGAAEPLTRDAPSKEMEETIGAILDRHYQTMVDMIAADRRLAPDAVKGLIDTALFSSEQAKAQRLVDDVMPFEEFRDAVTRQGPWKRVKLSESLTQDKLAIGLKLLRFLGATPPDRPAGDHVALVYALGNIIDGDGAGVLGARREIAAHTLVAALRRLGADDRVKAVVLRIDSGGGSAQASELIWRAVAEVKANKPVVVSMSDVAASGGYYIATGATKIFAHANTLTGSIGVVGGKLAPGGALAKVGVHAFPMGRGKRATMMASFARWTDDEKAAIRRSMEEVYRVFLGRVAAGRGKPVAQIEPIAQGRVWTGAKAKELGLVDELGGLDAAIAEAKRLGGVDAASELEVYPPPPTLRDLLQGMDGLAGLPFGLAAGAPAADAALTAIGAADPVLAGRARALLELVMAFRGTPIQAIAVLPEIR